MVCTIVCSFLFLSRTVFPCVALPSSADLFSCCSYAVDSHIWLLCVNLLLDIMYRSFCGPISCTVYLTGKLFIERPYYLMSKSISQPSEQQLFQSLFSLLGIVFSSLLPLVSVSSFWNRVPLCIALAVPELAQAGLRLLELHLPLPAECCFWRCAPTPPGWQCCHSGSGSWTFHGFCVSSVTCIFQS